MRTWSLRARLVALVLLLLAVAGSVIVVITAVVLRGFLIDRLDGDLRSASHRFGSGDAAFFAPGNGMLVAVVRDGRVLEARMLNAAGERPVPEPAELLPLSPGALPRTLDLTGLGEYRMVAVNGASGEVFVTGLPEATVDETVAALVRTELVVAGVTLLGAGTAGAVLIRRELRPLRRVAATAARVSALPLDRGEVDLGERVPHAGAGTEVGQVGAAFNRMLDHVGSALEARQDSETRLRRFVADASHELRTPLAAIRGYAELTRRDDELGPEAAHALNRISSQAERMSSLVEDLLLLARLDAGRPLEREPVDLTRLVIDAVSDAHAAGPDHRWRLDLPDDPLVVTGDAARLAQVLGNLLANARTHTPPGTDVTVGSAAADDGTRIWVVDSGPGIRAGLLPHVFERFARGSSSRSRTSGSTGLGLAIVDAVVTAHGGKVSVVSRPGRTAFSVWLPAPSAPR
ncbi:sensor histidine kinase [Actinomadura oligospora]|uniref:sensor histidine kinase n=1 Tax=Actinomadura oligospora TaxID=111804 RepID=UPI00047A0FE0|nr:HAMP domain-containing sensor histidine kinase [Actinomadura oligospora]